MDKNLLKGKNIEASYVFHGRDLFGYTAARFASGIFEINDPNFGNL